ncbi:hypothetical protein TIFTF001_029593 [Ficus carica]|uniref:Uncharacterized protein n=1 Tax=Ficus carica TaxID=3494 RepID=A0AA88J316_FICCA|nr:hypothetical protein TIFTF001_029593 [Ficus carica]
MGTPSAVEGISCFINDKERDWSPTMFNRIHSLWLLDINNSKLDLPPAIATTLRVFQVVFKAEVLESSIIVYLQKAKEPANWHF